MSERPTWHSVAKKALFYREESIWRVQPDVIVDTEELPLNVTSIPRDLLSQDELDITENTPEALLSSLASMKVSATTVVRSFLRRAAVAHYTTNCITELLPEASLERARFLDHYINRHKKPIGPLHGLPISVKEHIGMKHLGLNAGFVGWWDKEAEEDAVVLKILWDAGCVFYARTTQPQTLMHLETSNNLYGTTVNPFNRSLTSGGSSGGEGALLGMRGSCLGLGTDIGGSVRSPAANCGVYSLRPTALRVPYGGCADTADGQEQILGTIGPMSTSIGGLRLAMKTIIDAEPWLLEPSLIPMPWRDQQTSCTYSATKKLKIAIMWHDGDVTPHPPVTRAMAEVVQRLRNLDWVEIVQWTPYRHDKAWKIISALYYPNEGVADAEAIASSSEPWLPLSEWIIKGNPNVRNHSLKELWALVKQRDHYRTEYCDLWNDTAVDKDPQTGKLIGVVDVILCPAGPGVAPKLGTSKYWCYTSQWNLLDYPALTLPVSKVDLEKDIRYDSFEALSVEDALNWELYAGGPEDFKDAPISLQLVGRRFDDEKVIEVASQIQNAIGLPFVSYI